MDSSNPNVNTGLLLMHVNTGSAGDYITQNAQTVACTSVRANVINRCYSVHEKEGRPLDVISMVESGGYGFIPRPFFWKPVATNESQILVNHDGLCVKRKCCLYACEDSCVSVTTYVETSIEGTVTVHSFYSRFRNKTRKRNLGLIVIYRNINVNSTIGPATREDVRTYIKMQMDVLRKSYNIRQYLIVGDFNFDSSLSLITIGLREITDDRISHQHNATTKKTMIDKIYTNCNDVTIKDVMDPVENTSNPLYGHKSILIQIGKITGQRTQSRLVFSMRSWRVRCKQWIHREIPCGDELVGDKPALDDAAKRIILRLLRIQKECFVERSTRSDNKTILDRIEEIDHEAMKSPEASKTLKYFHQAFKADVERNTSKPTAEKLVEKGQTKLNELSKSNILVVKKVIWELHGDATPITPEFPSKPEFRKLIMSLKNSNAKDYHGLTTTQIKAWVRVSVGGFNDIYALAYASARTGYYPSWLRIDEIHFLYKRKGDRMDPQYYRPITLCPALAKIFDKITISQLQRLIDWCANNHAYIKFLSCQSALLDVSEFFRAQRDLCTDNEFIYIPIILCEDIAGAFESIEIEALCMIFGILFRDVADFKIVDFIRSYFERTSFVREGETELELIRRFLNKTSPQGSILSPAFWRFYDALFTKRYLDRLQALSEELDYVRSINYTSFADDKKTQAVLRFKRTETNENIKLKLAEFATKCRELLNISTRELGCRIQSRKSEVILPAVWQVADVSKIEYVWLGYTIIILANMHLVLTDTRMIQRFETSRKITRDMYQYITSLFARWKIYKMFVCPLIEWFLPVMLTARSDSLAIKNKIEVFQMDALCDALMIPRKVNRNKLLKLVREKPVRFKMMAMSARLAKHINRGVSDLKETVTTPASTRSRLNLNKYPSANHKDLGDRVLMFEDTYKNLPKQEVDNFKKRFYFDTNKITRTTKAWAKAVSKHANGSPRVRRITY